MANTVIRLNKVTKMYGASRGVYLDVWAEYDVLSVTIVALSALVFNKLDIYQS